MIGVIAILAVACTGAPAATPIVIYVTPGPEASTTPLASAPVPPTSLASTPGPPSATPPRATPSPAARVTLQPAPARADIEVTEFGFSIEGNDATYGVLIRNPNAEGWVSQYIDVQITFFDANGPTSTESDTISALLPGQTTGIGNTAYDVGKPTRMEVRLGSSDWEEIDYTPGRFVTRNVQTKDDRYGGHTTKGVISSEFEDRHELIEVTAIYRNAAGEIIGGDFTFVDFLDPDAEASFEVNHFETIRGLDSTEVYWQF